MATTRTVLLVVAYVPAVRSGLASLAAWIGSALGHWLAGTPTQLNH